MDWDSFNAWRAADQEFLLDTAGQALGEHVAAAVRKLERKYDAKVQTLTGKSTNFAPT